MSRTITRRRTDCVRSNAFTLIELLVVVAIIALLAAILFPVFARARENARRSACSSNMKQIGLALMQYSQDYDEKLVPVGLAMRWANLTVPYAKSTQIYDCPSFTGVKFTQDLVNNNATNATSAMSYAINEAYWQPGAANKSPNANPPVSQGNSGLTGGAYVTSLAQFESPASTVWVTDGLGTTTSGAFYWETDGNPTLSGAPRQFGTSAANGDVPVERHLETCNVLYTDGHVKAMRLDKLMTLSTTNSNVMKAFSIEDD